MRIVLAFSIFLVACNPPTTPSTTIYVNQTVSLADGGTPDGVTGTCAPISRVNISEFPATLAVGQSERIDVTPKDINGKPRDPDCDIKSGVKWDSNDDVCVVGDDSEFVTTIKGVKAGDCNIKACVENICDSESFNVS